MSRNELDSLMVTMFLGYKYRKSKGLLYSHDAVVPISLIKMYYDGDIERIDANQISKNFINHYINSESYLEGVHSKGEIKGVGLMYEKVHELSEDEFELFSLIEMHRNLYALSEYPEFGGKIRNSSTILHDCAIDTSPYENILSDLISMEDYFNSLKQEACLMRDNENYNQIIDFVKRCMVLKCRLLQIHPFMDGNGRTVRCFINKLFQLAGIPPVYIFKNEKGEYKKAVIEAQKYRNASDIDDDSKYDLITNFYLYKICDSIIELDINSSIKEERNLIKKKRREYE